MVIEITYKHLLGVFFRIKWEHGSMVMGRGRSIHIAKAVYDQVTLSLDTIHPEPW